MAFYLAYLLAFYLTFHLAYLLAFYLTVEVQQCTFFLTFLHILCPISSYMRSGREHLAWILAVEVRQGTLGVDGRG